MSVVREMLIKAHTNEEGHLMPGVGTLVGAVGAIVLGIGAANGSDGLAITGGIVTAVGILAAGVLHHREVDYDIFRRLDKLERK